jgi:hypothetical protein
MKPPSRAWLVSSKTRGGYAAFKINASKKEGGAPENVLDNANLQETPPKVLIDPD